MDFIFFQVGESEEAVDKDGNITTVLTKKGAKSVVAAARGIGRIIPRKVKIEVWSSMEMPASQTAEYITEELGVKRKFVKTLETTDLHSFLQMAFEYAKGDTLIIIGHHDNVFEWTEKLTGLKLPFINASAIGLSIDPAIPDTADLLWFMQPKYLKNIG